MATITNLGLVGGVNNTAFNSPVLSANVGDWLLLVLAASNSTFGDSGDSSPFSAAFLAFGGTCSLDEYVNTTWNPGGIDSGTSLIVCAGPVTVATGASSRVRVTFRTSEPVKECAGVVWKIAPAAGETIAFVSADNSGSQNGTDSGHAANTVSVVNSQIIFGCAALETNDSVTGDSDTTNGSWSAVGGALLDGGTDDTSQTAISQYKTVTATGNQSWQCNTVAARDSCRSYIIFSAALPAYSIVADPASYALSGTAATMRLGIAPMVAGAGSYSYTGTDATPELGRAVAATAGSYALTGTDTPTTHQWVIPQLSVGGYALFGTDASPFRTPVAGKTIPAEAGGYSYTGTDAVPEHGFAVQAVAGAYSLTGTDPATTHQWKLDATVASSYALTGSSVGLNAATGNKTAIADPGTYALTGTDATLRLGHAVVADPGAYALTGSAVTLRPSQQPPVMGIVPHFGESLEGRKRRKAREAAKEKQYKAEQRFRDAIGRMLEGLPPEFDEPEELAQAEAKAVEAYNLLSALRAPTPELDQVSQLIDHIRQLRIAKPLAQLALAKAFNQSHRYIKYKGQEDAALSLLLGD